MQELEDEALFEAERARHAHTIEVCPTPPHVHGVCPTPAPVVLDTYGHVLDTLLDVLDTPLRMLETLFDVLDTLLVVQTPLHPLPRQRSHLHRGTSLIRNSALLRTYSWTIPRVLWWSMGGGCLL